MHTDSFSNILERQRLQGGQALGQEGRLLTNDLAGNLQCRAVALFQRAAQPAGGSQCLRSKLRTGLGRDDVYQVDMRSACLTGALASDPLILRPTGASDVVCDRMDMDIGVKTPIGATPCMIENVRRLTAQEVAAMPPRDLP